MLRIYENRFSLGKLSKMSQLGIAGIISSCAVVLVLGLMLFPSLPQDAQAVADDTAATAQSDDTPVAQNDTVVAPRATSVGINLASSAAFAEVKPTETGATTTTTTDLTITTTNSESYSLYLYSDGDSSLKSSDSANISSIIATQGDVGLTLSSLEPNTWGYNLGTTTPDANSTYLGVPTSSDVPILSAVSTPTGQADDAYKLSFGAKVDTTLPAGEYATTLTIAVVAQPRTVTITFNGNGADGGSMLQQTITTGDTENLTTNAFTRTGYEFTGWNTDAEGNGVAYADGAAFTASGDEQRVTLYAQWKKLTFACTARYKLQNADGSYPDDFTTVTVSDAIEYGEVCSYTTDQDSSQYTNQSASATVTGPTTLTVGSNGQVPRRTYSLTVAENSSYLSNPTGSGTYRWGQTVTIGVTKTANETCYSYSTPTWSRTSGSGTLNSTSGTSVTFTMGTSNATVTATNSRSNINQTITFRTSGGASSITLNGTSRTNGQAMSIACGTYSLSGSFSSGYEFSSWSATAGTIGSTSTLSTTYRVTGPATITLTGKSSAPPTSTGYMQDFTLEQCEYYAGSGNYTLRDRRDNNSYTVRYISGACWMTQNLRLSSGRTLTSADSNVARNWSFPTGSLTSGHSYDEARSTISSNTSYGGYYNFCAASAGTVCSQGRKQNATQDICPKGWSLPTYNELNSVRSYVSAFSPVYSGDYYYGSLVDVGSYGTWWSATASETTYHYVLYYHSGYLLTDDAIKPIGNSVRCILSS